MLELRPEGRAWRLSVTQVDGRDRRHVGGFDVTAAEWPAFVAGLQAFAGYVAAGERAA